MKVLSIDWDFFIQADRNLRESIFPDGGNENLPNELRDSIWAHLYAAYDNLNEIGIEVDEIHKIIQIIDAGKHKNTKYLIMDSHKGIYNFVKEHSSIDEPIHLTNIDYHHDVYTVNSDVVDCGNWMRFFIEEFPEESTYAWIARKDSVMDNLGDYKDKVKVTYDRIDSLKGEKFDLIFICRSAMWSPPHLDDKFIDAFEWMLAEYNVHYEVGLFEDRYSEEFKGLIDGYKAVNEMFNGLEMFDVASYENKISEGDKEV